MEVEVRDEGRICVVRLSGDVDLESSPVARRALLASTERSRCVLVDLSAVKYIDSSGIASLVEAYQSARGKQIAFALAAVSPEALRVLQLARLDKVFTIYATVADGLGA